MLSSFLNFDTSIILPKCSNPKGITVKCPQFYLVHLFMFFDFFIHNHSPKIILDSPIIPPNFLACVNFPFTLK